MAETDRDELGRGVGELGEFGLIERLKRRLGRTRAIGEGGAVRVGIGDDAAVLQPNAGHEIVATLDSLLEGVHFRRDWSRAADIGWKALAVNVSDIGAMGARPLGALVSLALPSGTPVKWVDALYAGLGECAGAYECPVVGGDTVRSPSTIAITVAVIGAVTPGRAVLRSGARRGDLLCVTGTLGESGAGLALLERGSHDLVRRYRRAVEWHRRPHPPVEAGHALAEAGLATAMMDLSDGLGSDLRHIAKASGVGAKIEGARLPVSDTAREAARELGADAVRWALFGGEDYQLLFTVQEKRFPEVPRALGPLGVTATIVGKVTARGVTLTGADGRSRTLRPEGFSHF